MEEYEFGPELYKISVPLPTSVYIEFPNVGLRKLWVPFLGIFSADDFWSMGFWSLLQ